MNEREFIKAGLEIREFLGFKKVDGVTFSVYKSRKPFDKRGMVVMKAEPSPVHTVDEILPYLKFKRYK